MGHNLSLVRVPDDVLMSYSTTLAHLGALWNTSWKAHTSFFNSFHCTESSSSPN